jgi:hypothetical protein
MSVNLGAKLVIVPHHFLYAAKNIESMSWQFVY